jgi:hypothetical protein
VSLAIFNILSDIFFYGFGGEPIFTLYEALTYGLFVDLAIAFVGGNLFGVKGSLNLAMLFHPRVTMSASPPAPPLPSSPVSVRTKIPAASAGSILSPKVLAVVGGAVLGFLWSFCDPLFYTAFFSPFLYGSFVNWSKVIFTIVAFIPGDIIVGILAGLAALRISRAI